MVRARWGLARETRGVGYARSVLHDRNVHWGWRIFWGLVGGGLTAVVLVAAEIGLSMEALVALSVVGGIVVGIFGPLLLELLTLVP